MILGLVLLVVLALIAGTRVRVGDADLGLVAVLLLASVGKRLAPMWGALNLILGVAAFAAGAAMVRDPQREEAAAVRPPGQRRALRATLALSLSLFALLQGLMFAYRSVEQTLRGQREITSEMTFLIGRQFMASAVRGLDDEAYSLMSGPARKSITAAGLSAELKLWRDGIGQIKEMSPQGVAFGLGSDGGYTTVAYKVEGTRGSGQVLLLMVREGENWSVSRFVQRTGPPSPKPPPGGGPIDAGPVRAPGR